MLLLAGVLGPVLLSRRAVVSGSSMAPVLQPGDRLLVRRATRPRCGQVVVCADPRPGADRRELVKRVAAVSAAGCALTGDHPPTSTDSRTFGLVAWPLLRGVAWYRYAPPARAGRLADARPPGFP